MSSIAIIKQIVDLLYEESKLNDANIVRIKLKNLEREIQEKNTEIAQLCTENIKLENMLRKYETDFEKLTNISGSKPDETVHTESETKNQSESQTASQTEPKTTNQTETETDQKKDRKDYMKEYQRNYRKKRKEEKQMSMNV
jgi:hypothetical protein